MEGERGGRPSAGSQRRRRQAVQQGGAELGAAMLDCAELGKALAAHPGDIETALAAYEQALSTAAPGRPTSTSPTTRPGT
ncbi:hypothetical protein [Streptomyces sp. NPDC088725]|uniref:hypothetical protein n=1 Tax=Streptomyces sp. NPDC088725 TaxID=3365873 RepID=UPI00380EEE42